MSICRVISCVTGRGCLLWPVCSLDKTLLVFPLLHFVLQGQTCLLIQVFLDFLLLLSSPLWWEGHLLIFDVSSRRSCRSSQNQSTSASSALVVWGIELDYCDVEWFALEMNQDHSVLFEVVPNYCISDCFVVYEAISFLLKDSCPQ